MTARPRRITFPGSTGAKLAARLDLPAGPVRAYALFAHCFTCGKDLRSASRIAAGLTRHGIGVLRFDVTGLGDSEGDFANTDVTTNVADLVAAADWLRAEHRAPQLLVGHSLGGAASLLAAAQIPELRAVATIGAPSDTSHLSHLFSESVAEIRERGEARVDLAGRGFTIRAEFLDDLERHVVTRAAAELKPALLVLHSPVDQTVGIDHAAAIYTAARHPKSFIGLDGADHLLSKVADAEFASAMIAAWVQRHVIDEVVGREPPRPTAQVVVAETTLGPFHNHVVAGRHQLVADEPESIGGYDAGPSPYDLMAAALGACTSMTVRMYADRKGFPLTRVSVEVSHDKVHAVDASTAAVVGTAAPGQEPPGTAPSTVRANAAARMDRFTRVVTLEGDLDDTQRAAMLKIADRCPVHRTLEQSSVIETALAATAPLLTEQGIR